MLDRTAGSEGRGEGWSWKQEAHWAVAMGLSHPGGAWSRVGLEPRSLLGLAMGLSCRRGREEGSREIRRKNCQDGSTGLAVMEGAGAADLLGWLGWGQAETWLVPRGGILSSFGGPGLC